MKQLTINVEYEVYDQIIRDQLKEEVDHMKNSIELRKKDAVTPMFSFDKEEDLQQMQKHLEAFELTLKWFS